MEEKELARHKKPSGALEPDKNQLQEAHDTLKKLETQSGGTVKAKAETDEHHKRHIDTEEQYAQKIHTGHIGSVLFICVAFMLSVIGLLFISPMILLINNKEQLVNDLNDGLYAYHTYTNKVLGMQLGGNCSDETIECKFKTMSPMLKKRFENYGFTVAASEVKKTKRYNVQSLIFPRGLGVAVNDMTLSAARKDRKADTLMDKVYSSRTGVYQDQKFYKRLSDQFGLEQANTVSGTTVKEYDKDFDRRVKEGDSGRYQDSKNDEIDDTLDANGRGIYSLGTLADMSGHFRDDIYTNLVDKSNNHMALACAFATYGHLAENSVRKAKITTIARFAMNYLSLADDLKSGISAGQGGNEVAVESLANKLMKAGSDGKNAMDADSYRAPALGESPSNIVSMLLKFSPAQLFLLIKPGAPSFPGSEYLKGALNVVRTNARDRTPSGLCSEGMSGAQTGTEQGGLCWSPASMPLASYIGVAAGGVVASQRDPIERFICPFLGVKVVLDTIVKPATRPEATATLPERIKMASNEEAKKFKSSLTGVEAQDVIFSGTGILLGDRAQSLGMRPANILTLTTYLKMAEMVRKETEAQNRELARETPWDATNPYSFIGTVVSKFAPAGSVLPGDSLTVNATSILSLLPTSLSTVALSSADALYTQPMHFNPARLRPATACGIGNPGEFDAQIMPDMGCNIRYSMSIEELKADLGQVIDYMTKAHPDNARDSLQDIQSRDVGADPNMGGKMKAWAEEGSKATYVDKKTGKPNKYTEYAKFLEYCVDRADPWGGVGMAVQPKKEDPENEETNEETNDQSIISSGSEEEKPDEKNVAESYYALGWGGAVDQDWYTGKRCVDDSGKYREMLKNFRAYTMACSILADLSGSVECWDKDKDLINHDDFYTTNNIIFKTAG